MTFLQDWIAPISGVLSAIFTGWAAWAASKAAQAAASQAEMTTKQLINGQRAWISIKTQAVGPVYISPDSSVSLRLCATLTNLGKSPALEVVTHVEMFDNWQDVRSKAMAVAQSCQHEAMTGPKNWSNNSRQLHAGESYDRTWVPSAPPAEIQGEVVTPLVIVCVTYRIMHDERLHQTVFNYGLSLDDGRGEFIGLLPVNQGKIEVERIHLSDVGGSFST